MKLNIVDNLKGYDRILVTSALPYVNYEPHLGHLAGAVLSADVYAKYLKLKKVPHVFICGTDENGTTTEVTAKKLNIDPMELCNKYHKIHKEAYEGFGIEFDAFGRTTSEFHKEMTQKIYLKLKENGYIIEKETEQAYCEHCKMELADRYIIGTCPYCGYEHAHGGQCENCGKLLEPKDLINPKCAICGNRPIFRKTKHLYLDLPKLKPKLEEFINSRERLSENAKAFTLNMLKELKPRAISRKINFGIPIPNSDLVFYVWFDAPIGYISITYEYIENADEWWHGNTRLVQFMGKDNIPFHTILFPAELIGTHEKWTLVDTLSSTEYLNYEGGKFSKSQKRGVFCRDALSTKIPADYWRFYLMLNRPEKSDTNFSWNEFYERINNDLIGNMLNFIYRTMSLTKRYFNEIPEHKYDEIFEKVIEKVNELDKAMDEIKIRDYVKLLLEISSIGNKFLQENEPWHKIKEDENAVKHVLANAMEIVKVLAIVSYPIIPNISKKLQDALKLKEKGIETWLDLEKPIQGEFEVIRLGEKLKKEFIDELKERFSGAKDFSILNLKVAKIMKVEPIEHSNKLYRLEIDLGTEKRQLVAGLRKYYKPEELLNRNIVVVTNLKPAKLAGVLSEGMLLAADNDKDVKLLEAPNSKPGMQVKVHGYDVNQNQITIDDFLKVKLSIKNGVVVYNDMPLHTEIENITCNIENEENAKIR